LTFDKVEKFVALYLQKSKQ